MPSWRPRRLEHQLALVFGAFFALLLAGMAGIFLLLKATQESAELVYTGHLPGLTAAMAAERALSAADDAAVRYYLSGSPEPLRVRQRQLLELTRDLDAVRAAAGPDAERELRSFEALLKRYDAKQEALIARRRRGPLDAASAMENSDNLMGRMVAVLAGLRAERSAAVSAAREKAAWAVRRAWALSLLLLAASAAGLVLVRRLAAQRLLAPMERLADFADEVGRGHFRRLEFPRLALEGASELEAVGRALDAMSTRLAEQVEKLRQLDLLKSKFVSTVSHEFRIPLTSMQEFAAMLREGMAGPLTPAQLEHVEVIEKNVSRLKVMVENLLNLAKIEAGRFELQKGRVELPRLLEEQARTLAPLRREKNVLLAIDAEPNLPPVAADAGMLSLVLGNLMGNAVKYNRRDGTVKVRALVRGRGVLVEVSDTGPGIPPDELPRIFEAFYRGSGGRGAGTGLGLPISRDIVEAHGGRLRADSEPGRGSRFSFELERWDDHGA